MSDFRGIRLIVVVFCVSGVPSGKVYPDPPGKCLALLRGIPFSWFFVFPMSPPGKSRDGYSEKR